MKKNDFSEDIHDRSPSPARDPKSIQFDLSRPEEVRVFSKLIDELQSAGARWQLQQDGLTVCVVLS